MMRGYFQTGGHRRFVQMVFTQNVADAAFVSVKTGSG
jgi:hypothetical protein